MSTRGSIKWREKTPSAPGFHLWEDVDIDDRDAPVYLRIDGADAICTASEEHGPSITVTLPRETARALGLLPARPSDDERRARLVDALVEVSRLRLRLGEDPHAPIPIAR